MYGKTGILYFSEMKINGNRGCWIFRRLLTTWPIELFISVLWNVFMNFLQSLFVVSIEDDGKIL